jgi:hypothetical protein
MPGFLIREKWIIIINTINKMTGRVKCQMIASTGIILKDINAAMSTVMVKETIVIISTGIMETEDPVVITGTMISDQITEIVSKNYIPTIKNRDHSRFFY